VLLYLVTGLAGLWWSVTTLNAKIYGEAVDRGAALVFLASLAMLVGALTRSFNARNWARWIPFTASCALTGFFLIAIVLNVKGIVRDEPSRELILPLTAAALAVISFTVTIGDTRRHLGR
jgi:peptidoglycan/LPS O-acetylase OafA/YrhL